MQYKDLQDGDVISTTDRPYAIGDTAYKFCKKMSAGFAVLNPVMFVDGDWKRTQLGKTIYKEFTDTCTLLAEGITEQVYSK